MRLSVLGSLTIVKGENQLRFAPKPRSILAYLTVQRGNVVTAEQILDAVWGDNVPSGGRRTLGFHLSGLRAAIGDDFDAFIKTVSGGYTMELEPSLIDSHEFESLLDQALEHQDSDPALAAELADQGLALWSGDDPYSDLRYASFLQTEIRRLLDRKMACAEVLYRGRLIEGNPQSVLKDLPEYLDQAPFNEALHHLYMEALSSVGRRVEALRHYDTYVEKLATETGNTPQADLQALALQLVADEEPRPVLRESNLPAGITPLIGRKSELERLTSLMREHRYVDVLGPGGIGKSRLATEAVRQAASLEDAVGWFIDLTRSQDSVIGAVADTLGLKDRPGEDLREVVCEAVGPTRAYFLFDNCEALVSEVASLAKEILRSCPGSRVVTTSRFVTDQISAAAFRMTPMVSEAPADDGPRLFLNRAHAVGANLSDEHEDTAIEIVKKLDGMPLAIELAASQLGSRSIDDLHTSLVEGGVRAFDESFAAAGDGPLWQMLHDSFELLSEEDRDHLRHVSVFSGGFTAADASDLVGVPTRRAEAELQRLNQRSLVVAQPTFTPTRYRLLDTVREYLADINTVDGFIEDVNQLHLEWCEDLTRACRRGILTDSTVLEHVAQRLANIRSAVDRLESDGDANRLARLISRLDLFWVISGRAAEGLRHMNRAFAVGIDDPAVEANAFSSAALLASIDREYELAESWFARALELGEHAPHVVPLVFANRARSTTAQVFSGFVDDRERSLEGAGRDFQVALDFFDAVHLVPGLVTILPFAAWHAILIGDPALAESYCERTIVLGEEEGFGWPAAVARAIRGLSRLSESRPAEALTDLREAEAGFEEWGDRYSMQITHSLHSAAQLILGDTQEASTEISAALAIMETQGSREWEAMTTGIALAVMQAWGLYASLRSSCYRWLESRHEGWQELMKTVGVEAVPEPAAGEETKWATASQMARDCREALEHDAVAAEA